MSRPPSTPQTRLGDHWAPTLTMACRRCPRVVEFDTRKLDRMFGRGVTLRELLFDLSSGCGRHPNTDHRVGKRDERCEAYFLAVLE